VIVEEPLLKSRATSPESVMTPVGRGGGGDGVAGAFLWWRVKRYTGGNMAVKQTMNMTRKMKRRKMPRLVKALRLSQNSCKPRTVNMILSIQVKDWVIRRGYHDI
jgi:hypothetical protein